MGEVVLKTEERTLGWDTQLVRGPTFCGIFFWLCCNIIDWFFESILKGVDPIHQLSILLIIACQVIVGQSRHSCSFMFDTPISCPVISYVRCWEVISTRSTLLSDFPGDPCPAEKALCLDHQSIIFTICPKDSCHQIHKPTFNPDSPFLYIQNIVMVITLATPARMNYFALNKLKEIWCSFPSNPSYTSIQKTG